MKILIVDSVTMKTIPILKDAPIPRIGEKVDLHRKSPYKVIDIIHDYKDKTIYVMVR